MLKTKLFTGAVALTMVLSMVAVPASAQTVAELQAQIANLQAMINALTAQLAGGTATTAGTTFTKDLTIGSTGSEVSALQQWLVAQGYLTMPAGVAYGYFGSLTQAALAKYQAAVGISPAAGYFGPITRAKVNAAGTTTGGTTTGGATGITTPGVEGTLSVSTNNSGLVSTVYEGDDMAPIYGFNVEAKNSDIAIQRIKVDLGSDSIIYNKGYSKMYVTVDGNVVASTDLNSSTVVKESSEYYVTIAGFNYVVPKNTKKQFVLKVDVFSNIDSTDMDGTADSLDVVSITIPINGVRGVDGAGIDQYGASAALTGRTTAFSASLSETATLKVSLNNSSPKKQEVVASSGASENELDKMTLMVFDLKAEKDAVTVDDMRIGVTKASGNATAQTAYLFDGSTELDNASVSGGMASFTDLGLTIPKDSTKTITVKIDVRSADGTATPFVGTASTTISADLVSENSQGDSVTESGSATGYEINVRDAGAEITLNSKSITTSGAPQVGGTSAPSTSTLTATFNVTVKAVGGDLILGTTASTTYPFFEDAKSSTSGAPSFKVYRNGAVDGTITSAATSTSYTIPSTCTSNGTNSCILSEGNSVSFPITIQLQGRKSSSTALDSGLYSIQYASANWISPVGTVATATFMDAEADWRTSDVSFP